MRCAVLLVLALCLVGAVTATVASAGTKAEQHDA